MAEYSVLILGLDNAGKTTFLEKLKSIYLPNAKVIPPERIIPTIGQNVSVIPLDLKLKDGYRKNQPTLLKFWDVGGQNAVRELWSEYYELTHGIIFVIDSTDRERLIECQQELTKIMDNEYLENIPILMCANKQDVTNESKLEVEDIKEIFNVIAEHLNARDSRVLPISAMTGDGISEAINWLGVRILRNKLNKPPDIRK